MPSTSSPASGRARCSEGSFGSEGRKACPPVALGANRLFSVPNFQRVLSAAVTRACRTSPLKKCYEVEARCIGTKKLEELAPPALLWEEVGHSQHTLTLPTHHTHTHLCCCAPGLRRWRLLPSYEKLEELARTPHMASCIAAAVASKSRAYPTTPPHPPPAPISPLKPNLQEGTQHALLQGASNTVLHPPSSIPGSPLLPVSSLSPSMGEAHVSALLSVCSRAPGVDAGCNSTSPAAAGCNSASPAALSPQQPGGDSTPSLQTVSDGLAPISKIGKTKKAECIKEKLPSRLARVSPTLDALHLQPSTRAYSP
eukprot:1138818-Pelagomonas_calceolata.AAC.12